MANNSNDSKKYISLTRLSTFLDNLTNKFAALSHKHTTADLTDYTVDSALSPTSTNPVQNKVLDAEFEAMATAMNILEQAIDDKADKSHAHIITESDLDSALAEKVNAASEGNHTHSNKAVLDGITSDKVSSWDSSLDSAKAYTDTALTGKSDSNHNHDSAYDTKGAASTALDSAKAYADQNKVPTSRTVNGKALSTNITLSASDVGALPNTTSIPDSLSDLSSDSTHRTVTDTEKATWNAKSNFSGNYNDLTNKPTIPSISGLATETYADTAATTAANKVKNDLLNGAGTAYDTLKELGDLIDDNQDAIEALEAVAAGKADKTHAHAIADVSGLQSALDGKAASSHGTHVSYSTTAPVMDGTASVGTASTVARSDHKHPTDTSRAAKTDLDTHTANTTVHITSTERTNWNAAKTTADSAKTRADNAYTLAESKVDSLSDLGITATATELNYVDGVTSNVQTQLDGKANTTHIHPYGVCSSSATYITKAVTVDNFSLVEGARVIVKFTNANNASSPKLNVNDTGAKPIMRYGTTAAGSNTATNGWEAGAVLAFTYDGTNWVQDYWYNTTYTNASLGQGYGTCYTSSSTAEKTVSMSNYEDKTGGIVSIKFTYSVDADATLNINSKGAMDIYYKGSAIVDDVIKGGDIATFICSGSTYHLISVDRWFEDIVALQANDKKVRQMPTTTNGNFRLLLTPSFQSEEATAYTYFDSDVYLNPYYNKLYGVDINGNAGSASELSDSAVLITVEDIDTICGATV